LKSTSFPFSGAIVFFSTFLVSGGLSSGGFTSFLPGAVGNSKTSMSFK